MPLETATTINQLVASNPADTDSEGLSGAHLRLIKSTLLATFANVTAAVTATAAQLNSLATGVLTFAAGTVGAPSISTAADPTTGMYFPGTGQMAVAIEGVEAVVVSSDGLNITEGTLELAGTAAFPVASANIAAGAVNTAALAASGVTYAKMQNESATTLLGNPTGSAAAPSEITLGVGLGFSGTTLVNTGPAHLLGSVSPDLQIITDATNPNTQVDYSCSEAVLSNGSGGTVWFGTISGNIVTTSVGAGGMGTTTGTRATSQSYFWWLISNGSAVAGLGSKQSTLAGLLSGGEMPSGYTYAKRIGANFTDASSNLYRVRQVGKDAQYVVTASTNTAALPFITSTNNEGSITVPTWVQKPLASIVPTTASRLMGVAFASGTTDGLMVAPNNSYGAFNSSTNPPPVQIFGGGGLSTAVVFEFTLETQNIYTANNFATGNARIQALGWEDAV